MRAFLVILCLIVGGAPSFAQNQRCTRNPFDPPCTLAGQPTFDQLLETVGEVETPVAAHSGGERLKALTVFVNQLLKNQNIWQSLQSPALKAFFSSLQPQFIELKQQNKIDPIDIEATFRVQRFGWLDTQRSAFDQLIQLHQFEIWAAQQWGPAYGNPDLVVNVMIGSLGAEGELSNHYVDLLAPLQNILEYARQTPLYLTDVPLILYVPYALGTNFWAVGYDRFFLHGTPENRPLADFGVLGGERLILQSLSKDLQRDIADLNQLQAEIYLQVVPRIGVQCEKLRQTLDNDILKTIRKISRNSPITRVLMRTPGVQAIVEQLDQALPTLANWSVHPDGLTNLLSELGQNTLEPVHDLKTWAGLVDTQTTNMSETLREEARSLKSLILAAQSLGDYVPYTMGMLDPFPYQDPEIGFNYELGQMVDDAFNGKPGLLPTIQYVLTRARLAQAQMTFEMERLKRLAPDEFESISPLSDEQAQPLIKDLTARKLSFMDECSGYSIVTDVP